MKKKQGVFLIPIICSPFSKFSVFVIFSNLILAHSLSSTVTAPRSWYVSELGTYNSASWKTLLSTTACLETSSSSLSFHLAFYRNNTQDIVLAIFVFQGSSSLFTNPVVVWNADVSHSVTGAATLDLSATRGLVFRDKGGNSAWSTKTLGSHLVSSMNLTCQGNLVLLNHSGGVVWQSFDHPTDTWLSGQTLDFGQTLTSRISSNNFTAGNYSLSVREDDFHASVHITNSLIEYSTFDYRSSVMFNCLHNPDCSKVTYSVTSNKINYLRLDQSGHLNYYTYEMTEDFVASLFGDINYPTSCGSYGVCFIDNNKGVYDCQCPADAADQNLNYFKPVDVMSPEEGCIPVNPLVCPDAHKLHTFIKLEDVGYFGFESYLLAGVHDIDSCKAVCLETCSCKAVLFRHRGDISSGDCSLPTEVLTLMQTDPDYNFTAFIKVQKEKAKSSSVPKLVPTISVILFIILCIGGGSYVMVLRRKSDSKESKSSSDLVIVTVARFSFESLRLATLDFQNKLGHGGFGSVFEGTLEDGTKVAVKRLDSVGQGRKEFLAEVNTIGNLHHHNLVRLIGFCDDGLNRLLVYEFMPNGSLDKWIFNQDIATLTWRMRQRIIGGIAKGLEYLHENCSQNVIHFDIKPQNILLSKDFNVKISDFGLAKMVDRDQSQVMTVIRGTRGYMAPELITAQAISVKADVYSFGVLILEIICGRRNFGSSEADFLTNSVKKKADEDQLSDLIDECVGDMQQHKEEAVKMMKIAIWCLQPHFIRPNMSMVVKVLQDLPDMDALSDLSYMTVVHEANPAETSAFSSRPSESLLSGPR